MSSTDRITLKYRLILVLPALTGVGIILVSTSRYGAGLSPDSAEYISIARNLMKGVGFVLLDGSPLTLWPPLYPALLGALALVFGIDPLLSAHIVNAFLFGCIVYLSGLLFFKHLTPPVAFALLGITSVLLSPPLIEVSLMAWSEPLFICLVLLFLIFSEAYVAQGDITSLLLLSLAVSLACLTKTGGPVLILMGAVNILLYRRGILKHKLAHLLLFMFVSIFFISIWMIRTYLVSGALIGKRLSSGYTLFQNIHDVFNTIVSWYIPESIAAHQSILILLSAGFCVLMGTGLRFLWKNQRAVSIRMLPAMLFTVFYPAFLIISSTIVAYDKIGSRILSPVFVPANLLALTFFLAVFKPIAGRIFSERAHIFLIASIALFLMHPAVLTLSHIAAHLRYGGEGYNSKLWRESETIQYLREHRNFGASSTVYSNDPPAVYLWADVSAKLIPFRLFRSVNFKQYHGQKRENNVLRLKGTWPPEGQAYLVWFDKFDDSWNVSIDEIGTIASIERIARLKDGAVYAVARR